MAQRVGRIIDLLFHDRGTRRGCVFSSTPRPHFTPGKDSVPVVQEAGWAPGPVWTGGKSRPHRDSIPVGNFQRDLVVMRFIRIELIMCSTSKVDRVKIHIHVVQNMYHK